MPLYIFNEEKESDYEILCDKFKRTNDIPIIIIDDDEYANFMKILEKFNTYEKFRNITILKEKFIISNKIFNKINHINVKKQKLFAECNIVSQIYDEKEYENYESAIKECIPKDFHLNSFIEEWVITLFNIMAEYVLFILKKQPLYFSCKKCNTPNLYIKCTNNDDNKNNRINIINSEKSKEEEENSKKNLILKNISLGIANLLIEYIDLNKLKIIKYDNIINKITNYQNNSLNNNNSVSLGDPPKKGNNIDKNKGENINVIYYDEDKKKERPIPSIYNDSNLFERIMPFGTFILVTDEKRLNLVLEELKKMKIMILLISI